LRRHYGKERLNEIMPSAATHGEDLGMRVAAFFRVAAKAAWASVVFSHGVAWRIRVEWRLPALPLKARASPPTRPNGLADSPTSRPSRGCLWLIRKRARPVKEGHQQNALFRHGRHRLRHLRTHRHRAIAFTDMKLANENRAATCDPLGVGRTTFGCSRTGSRICPGKIAESTQTFTRFWS